MKLTIDLGGTNIRIAQVENRKCLNRTSVPCPAQAESDTLLNVLSQLIQSRMTSTVTGIGVGVPSIVDAEKGIVYNATNISSWKEVPLKEFLESKFSVPVAVENDCNCFALGEYIYGTDQSCRNMVGITLGTGIGSGIIIDGKLYGGQYRGAGEIGSLPYLDSDFEHYCSSGFFVRKGTTGAAAASKADLHDPEALELWKEFGRHLGNMLKAVLFAYAPQVIVLGGGIASGFPLFFPSLREALNDFPYRIIVENTLIKKSDLQDTANLLGAAALLE